MQSGATGSTDRFNSKKPVWNTFYKSKADFLQVNVKDFFLSVNPTFFSSSWEKSRELTKRSFRIPVWVRGLIAKRLDLILPDRQPGRPPYFVKQFADSFHAVPGAGFYKPLKQRPMIISMPAALCFSMPPNILRSSLAMIRISSEVVIVACFSAIFGNNCLFLKLNTKIWKLNYRTCSWS